MKMRMKRAAGIFLSLTLLIGVLGGCGQTSEEDAEQERGRYVQKEILLPEEWEGQTIKQIFTVEDNVHILTAEQQGEGSTFLREWEQQGETFADVTADWLAELELPCETWVDMQLMQGDSTQYLYVQLLNGDHYEGHLWRGGADGAVDITPEKWTIPDETWGIYEYVQGIAVLENETLAAVSYRSIDILSGEDGSIQQSEDVTTGYGEKVLSDGRNLYLTTLGSSGGVDGLEKRPGGDRENAEEISLPVSSLSGPLLSALKDGTLVAAAAEGIFRYNIVSESWEKLLEGSETDFALTTRWCVGLTALADGRIYALFRQDDGSTSLMLYEYDPDAVTEITEELKLYTVWENSLLQQAAVLYHKSHPEVLITVEYTYSSSDRYSNEAPDYEQVYQTLNTRLMGEDAPDILVMDHLNVESYAEKGLLADISEILEPMESDGEVLANITGAYAQADGSRYVVPLQFGFPMAVGRDITAADMESMEALADFLSGKQESYMGPLTVSELVDQFYPYFCNEIVKDGELDRAALGEVLGYLKMIGENSGIVEAHGQDERQYNYWDLTSKAKCIIETADGFWDCMTLMAFREYIKGEFAGFENCFVPHLLTGINVRSPYLDTAEDFLRFALSQEAQDTEFYNGFPVNRGALEALAGADRSNLAMETAIVTDDGGMEPFQILDYSQEIAQELVEICERLDRPAVEDAKIREELIAALPGYLEGSRNLEETLDAIEGGLRMYLAE